MRVWLMTIGEPLPTDGPQARLLRTGMLAAALAAAGHEVIWWSSTFDHTQKRQRFRANTSIRVENRYQLNLLYAVSYPENVSLRRLVNHYGVARAWSRWADRESQPDVIVCALPTLELCDAATRYGRRRGVPVVLDVRDLWPDVFLDLAPTWARSLARVALAPLFTQVRTVCARATALMGVTPAYVGWATRQAGRAPSPLDCDFPIGYRQTSPSPPDREEAEAFWRARGITETAFIVCFFGTLGRQFDLKTVIDAARKLRGEDRPVHFVLCGHGDYAAHYKALAGDCAHVVFPGWVGMAQIWTLMRLSAVGLAPYVSHGNFIAHIPNKPAEYLSAGLPILSGVKGALADLLATHQCGVTYDGADDLARTLLRLRDDLAWRRTLAANAARLYQRQFSAEKINAEMMGHLEKVRAVGCERQAA